MTIETACELSTMRRPFVGRSLVNVVAGDERFVRSGDLVGLVAWGMQPRRTIIEALEEAILARGGVPPR